MAIQSPVRVVSEKSRNDIRKQAYMLRKKFGFEQAKCFPIIEFLELVMPQVDPHFSFELVEDFELPGQMAITVPEQHLIRVRHGVYESACNGTYYARLVLAHELGHYLLHNDEEVSYAFPAPGETIPNQINPEWQADVFAEELLAPVHLINESDTYLVVKHFGVSYRAARHQLYQANKVKKRHQRHRDTRMSKENG